MVASSNCCHRDPVSRRVRQRGSRSWVGADGPDHSGWPFAVAFGVFFVIAAWLLRSGRIVAGAVFAGILCLFEILSYPSWYKHGALSWTYDTAFALVALAGLIGVITVLAGRLRRRVAA